MNALFCQVTESINILHFVLKTLSARRSASFFAATDPMIQVHWIAERWNWIMDSIYRVFLYIASSGKNDA